MARKKNEEITTYDKFTKKQIVSAKKYRNNVDLLNAILKNDKEYTLKEVDEIIENFKKGKV